MARPLSEEKRAAILDAAVRLVAGSGTGAPTAAIAREAGVAEGTLFTYFASKDELLNQLYRAIKTEFADAVLRDYPAGEPARERFHHIWDRYLEFGTEHGAKRRALRQLAVSDRITEESRAIGAASFARLRRILDDGLADGSLTAPSIAFLLGVMDTMLDNTMEFMASDPKAAARYREAGFRGLWGAISAP